MTCQNGEKDAEYKDVESIETREKQWIKKNCK